MKTNMEGLLSGFFYCMTCEIMRVNVLSQADVEDLYEVTYDPGVSFTVHMLDKDLVSYWQNKLYIANMTDWIDNANLVAMTMVEKEHVYTRKKTSPVSRRICEECQISF